MKKETVWSICVSWYTFLSRSLYNGDLTYPCKGYTNVSFVRIISTNSPLATRCLLLKIIYHGVSVNADEYLRILRSVFKCNIDIMVLAKKYMLTSSVASSDLSLSRIHELPLWYSVVGVAATMHLTLRILHRSSVCDQTTKMH